MNTELKNRITELTKEIKSFEASGLVGAAEKLKKVRTMLYELESENEQRYSITAGEMRINTNNMAYEPGMQTSGSLEIIQQLVLNWANEKGIFEHGTALSQVLKLREEVFELEKEIERPEDENAILLEFGDVLVVLTILAKQLDIDFETALNAAYSKIKNRTGKMIDGTFVKD